ncbi:MAG: outer membrane lipoprotein LolB [Burkholderiales bacterium]|nr:outer membrane lipoprotein LolB [Burkholderiales bacterium]
MSRGSPRDRGRRGAVLALATAAALALSGCAVTGAGVPGNVGVDAFEIEGRVSVRYGDESLAGRLAWVHARGRDEIGLASPLGNQIAQIVRSPGEVVLIDAQQQRHRAADAESLTERQLGWRLPLTGLTDWVRARSTAPGQRDARGRLVALSEAGWQIAFSYDADATLPRRLVLSYAGGDRPLEIRLVIDAWK